MKIAVAMSGGIDSTIAAIKLLEEGHELLGVTARILPPCADDRENLCFTEKNLEDAKAVAHEFKFPHQVIDSSEIFRNQVIDPFCKGYLEGKTPNPCIICNPLVKFHDILAFADAQGCDAVATGHYAKITIAATGRYAVGAGVFPRKDQSYFLYQLGQDVLKRVIFPLGSHTKEEIFSMARERGLSIADKPESSEICFVRDGDYAAFIERWTGIIPPPGDIVDKKGTVLGRHNGIHRYTIGQRRGMGIASKEPLYVVRIDAAENRIIAGNWNEQFCLGCEADRLSYMKVTSFNGIRVLLKTRSTQPFIRATVHEEHGRVRVIFDEPLIGVTPGQAAVFYDEEMSILGGGIITRPLDEEGVPPEFDATRASGPVA